MANVANVTVSVTVSRYVPPPRLVLSKTSMSVTDNGSSDSLSVRLSKRPTGTVRVAVGFVSSGEDDATLSTSSLTFTTSTWNSNQTITVTGRNDGGSSTSETANFTLNPSGAGAGYTVTVSVTVSRYVSPTPVDRHPSLPLISNKSATVGTAFSFTAPAGTGGDAPLRHSASETGRGISLIPAPECFLELRPPREP